MRGQHERRQTAPASRPRPRDGRGDRGRTLCGAIPPAVLPPRARCRRPSRSARAKPTATGLNELRPADQRAAHQAASTRSPAASPTPSVSPAGASARSSPTVRATQVPTPRHRAPKRSATPMARHTSGLPSVMASSLRSAGSQLTGGPQGGADWSQDEIGRCATGDIGDRCARTSVVHSRAKVERDCSGHDPSVGQLGDRSLPLRGSTRHPDAVSGYPRAGRRGQGVSNGEYRGLAFSAVAALRFAWLVQFGYPPAATPLLRCTVVQAPRPSLIALSTVIVRALRAALECHY